MPSFFSSKKTRSQTSAGPASESSLGSAPPPPPPPDPYQQQQQQRTDYIEDSRLDQFRRPSESFVQPNQFQSHPAHSPYSAGFDVRYERDPSINEQQQQQQQQQQYRHPAHHPQQSSPLDRPTISLVTPQRGIPTEPPNYQPSPSLTLDRDSAEQQWTAHANTSSQDLHLQDKSGKLQKKKGFFSRNQSVASSSPGKQVRSEKSLTRSVSVKHNFSGQQHQHQRQQQRDPQQQQEHARVGANANLQTHHPNHSIVLDQNSLDIDLETARPSTGDQQPPPGSPGFYEPSLPQTPLDSLSFQLTDRGQHIWQHSRPDSVESIASQNSDFINSWTSSRRPSVQPSTLNYSSSVNDMAGSDRTQQQQQQQGGPMPTRKNSLAAPTGQGQSPHHQSALSGASSKGNSSQQNLHDMPAQGRETPPAGHSSKLREELESLDIGALVARHEELQAKYQKVKRYYFEKEAQVTQLQNTVAHQRMAVSRTVLDDNEYTARFNRLDGAIKELAFSIRKDWKAIPEWLHPYVNEDAVARGAKEMTGVGRAVISRWVVDEVFNRYFHPGLDRSFSEHLKTIELNLRQQQVQVFNDDDKENQVARISNWRRTTLDGLADELQSKATTENQTQLTEYCVEKLSTTLQYYLKEPAPPELAHYTQMIVENAINIAEKIPQESRDLIVDYLAPGTPISETTMKVETGMPPLTRAIAGNKDSAGGNRTSGEGNEEMDVDSRETNSPVQTDNKSLNQNQNREQRKKHSPFGSLMGKKSLVSSPSSNNNIQSPSPSSEPQQRSASGSASISENNNTSERDEQNDKQPRVRLATFMTVEVRGRGPNNVLIQAPVYTLEP